jgi:predicted DNA-binding ribbon-helix-helix protein
MKQMLVRIEEQYYDQIINIAESRNVSIAAVARDIISAGLSANVLETQRQILKEEVRLAVEDALKPSVNRLASISAKGSIISATATFLCMFVLNKIGGIDQERVIQLYEEAKKKAYLYVKESSKPEDDS